MISQSQVDQYINEGYTIVKNVFNMDELNPILNEFFRLNLISKSNLIAINKISSVGFPC